MKVIVFHTKSDNSILKSLVEEVEAIVPTKDFQLCHELEDLVELVRTICFEPNVSIIVVNNNLELEELLSIRKFLIDRNLIIVLPDDDRNNGKKARTLFPRFIGYLDNCYYYTTAVLEKMFEYEKRNQKYRWVYV